MISNKLLIFMAAVAVLVVGILVVSVALVFGVFGPLRMSTSPPVVIESTAVQATAEPPSPTATEILPTATQLPPSPTQELVPPTATLIPATGLPTLLPSPGVTGTPLSPAGPTTACDQALFVRDITIPNGVKVPAGAQFTKTWEVKNAGTCTWTADYDLVFSQGNQLSGPQTASLPGSVKPGESIELSLDADRTHQGWRVCRRLAIAECFQPGFWHRNSGDGFAMGADRSGRIQNRVQPARGLL